MVHANTLLLNIVWTFCAFIYFKSTLLVFFFLLLWGLFCSRSECERRKAIWDTCVAEIAQDPDQKKDFDTQMLAVMEQMGQYTQSD